MPTVSTPLHHQSLRVCAEKQPCTYVLFGVIVQTLCKVFMELMKNSILPPTSYSLLILLSLSDSEV